MTDSPEDRPLNPPEPPLAVTPPLLPPPPLPPPPLIMPGIYAPPGRPTAVTVISILLLVFAALGLLGILMSYGSIDSSGLAVFGLARGAIIVILQVALGVGLLGLRPWARLSTITFLIFDLGTGLVFRFIYLSQFLELFDRPSMKYESSTPPYLIGVLVGIVLFGIVMPIIINSLMIFTLTRRHIAEAFERRPY